MSAVDNEFSPHKQSDINRMFNIERTEMKNPVHPSSRFEAGNTQTLITIPESKGLNVTNTMRDWHRFYYQPSAMILSVLTDLPVEDVDVVLRPKLEAMKNVEIKPTPKFHQRYMLGINEPQYSGNLSKLITIEPVAPGGTTLLTINFVTESQASFELELCSLYRGCTHCRNVNWPTFGHKVVGRNGYNPCS